MATRKVVKGGHDIFTLAYKTLYGSNFSSCLQFAMSSYILMWSNAKISTLKRCLVLILAWTLIFEQFCTFQRITRVCGMKDDVKKEISISLYKVDLTKACCCTNFRFFLAKKKEEKNFARFFFNFGLLRVAKKLKVFWNEWGISNTF